MADRPSDRQRRRGGLSLGLLGALVLIVLLSVYLSDCIPGLGSGGEVGTLTPEPAAPTSAPATPEAAGDRITIVVQGEQCRRGEANAQPCPQLCAALDRTQAATVEVAIEAVEGRHGTVEELRRCLQAAGFNRVRVHAE